MLAWSPRIQARKPPRPIALAITHVTVIDPKGRWDAPGTTVIILGPWTPPMEEKISARRWSRDPAAQSGQGSPSARGDLRSRPRAASGDPRPARGLKALAS